MNARYEEIEKAAERYMKNIVTPLPASIKTAFIKGAEWVDEYHKPKVLWTLSAADRGIIDEIIFALNSLGEEKMISYHKEIEFLNKIRKL